MPGLTLVCFAWRLPSLDETVKFVNHKEQIQLEKNNKNKWFGLARARVLFASGISGKSGDCMHGFDLIKICLYVHE